MKTTGAIRFTIVPCSLGQLLVAGTERGICAISLADAEPSLAQFLAEEFLGAELTRDDARLRAWAGDVAQLIEGKRLQRPLPLDVQATPFQWRVWHQLQKIPYGSTKSYRAVAEAIGQPGAVRAVARACATNPVAVVIPCHRVVRADGNLAGFRWGLQRKRALLEREVQG